MDGTVPLGLWYVGVQVLSAVALTGTGYLVYRRPDAHHRREFVAYLGVQTTWLLVATAKFLVDAPAVTYALSLVTDLLAVGAITAVGYFATVYTNRSTAPRRPLNAVFLGWLVVAVTGILTQPLLGFQYASVSYRETPVAYLATTPGPTYVLNATVAAVVVVVSLGYLADLFISSSHRPTSSVLLLVAAAVAALVPNAVSIWTSVPLLPGYDYTALGIVPLSILLAYTVFFRGELDLAPMARAEIVDEIDDVLLGLDDAGRVIDYNAAAEALLPDITTPVGTALSELLPELAADLSLPSAGEDVSTTYSTVVNGRRTYYAVSVTPIVEREVVAGYTVVLRDVTVIERSKRELARQNEQLERFASTVAHDLRNPLQVADGAGTLLAGQLQAADATDAADHIDRATDAIARMDDRLDELRTLAKHAQSVDGTESVAFAPAVRAAWAAVDTGEMELAVGTDGSIEADRVRLRGVLERLVRDSCRRDAARIEVTLTGSGFRYTDDGAAIPSDEPDGVFEAGTTVGRGDGLGLEIVRTLAESQGWTVHVEPSTTGATFVATGAETALGDTSERGDPA